jgi:predicted DNA-binding protein (MmcQ/YjbR family)
MNIETIREYCLSKENVEEDLPFGPDVLVYKVGGKIFLLVSLDDDPLQFNVKCDPDLAIELREEFSCVIPGYHMNKKHWNTILVDGTAPSKKLLEWIDHSYGLVAGNSIRKKPRKAGSPKKNKN